jgi:hypothetical protein
MKTFIIHNDYAEISVLDADFSINYFPAYEIILDELRDYRFFKSDGVHPNEMSIQPRLRIRDFKGEFHLIIP